jgi:hypothetical protein
MWLRKFSSKIMIESLDRNCVSLGRFTVLRGSSSFSSELVFLISVSKEIDTYFASYEINISLTEQAAKTF